MPGKPSTVLLSPLLKKQYQYLQPFQMHYRSSFQPEKQGQLDLVTLVILVMSLSSSDVSQAFIGGTGINVVAGSAYTATFFFRFPTASTFSGNLVVGLQTTGGSVLASATTAISGSQTTWKQVTVTLNPTITPSSTANLFTITLDGAAGSGQTIHFAMLSLFPPTFKNRANGMRVDIASVSLGTVGN